MINSTKSMIGHLLGAAGGVEFITCVKTIQDNFIHQTVGTETPDEECDLNYAIGAPVKTSGELQEGQRHMEMEKMIELIDAVSKSDLTGFKYEEDGIKLHLSKKENTCYVTENVSAPVNMTGTASAGVVSAEMGKTNAEGDQTLGAAAEEAVAGNIVESPLVGTFYSAPAEDAESFVKVGDRVEKGQTLGIVEAMKLMNEIESDYSGTVAEILVNNQEGVEYGQPLFRIV